MNIKYLMKNRRFKLYKIIQYAKWNKISVLIFTRYKVVFHVILASELKGSFRRNINVAFAEHQKIWLSPKWWGRPAQNYECGFRRNLKYEYNIELSIERMSDSTWFSPSTAEHDACPKLTRIEVIHLKLLRLPRLLAFFFERFMVRRLICLNAVL